MLHESNRVMSIIVTIMIIYRCASRCRHLLGVLYPSSECQHVLTVETRSREYIQQELNVRKHHVTDASLGVVTGITNLLLSRSGYIGHTVQNIPLIRPGSQPVVRQLLPVLQRTCLGVSYNSNGQLQQTFNPNHEQLLWILMYADDFALVTEAADSLRIAVELLDSIFSDWVLTVSTVKTKLVVGITC